MSLSNFVCENPACRDHVAMPANLSTDLRELYLIDELVGSRKVTRTRYPQFSLDSYVYCGPCLNAAKMAMGDA